MTIATAHCGEGVRSISRAVHTQCAMVACSDGRPDITNGITLCRHHHQKYHNDGTEIIRDQYWKIPPQTADATQTPIHMPLKTKNLHDLFTATTRQATTRQATTRQATTRQATTRQATLTTAP